MHLGSAHTKCFMCDLVSSNLVSLAAHHKVHMKIESDSDLSDTSYKTMFSSVNKVQTFAFFTQPLKNSHNIHYQLTSLHKLHLFHQLQNHKFDCNALQCFSESVGDVPNPCPQTFLTFPPLHFLSFSPFSLFSLLLHYVEICTFLWQNSFRRL